MLILCLFIKQYKKKKKKQREFNITPYGENFIS